MTRCATCLAIAVALVVLPGNAHPAGRCPFNMQMQMQLQMQMQSQWQMQMRSMQSQQAMLAQRSIMPGRPAFFTGRPMTVTQPGRPATRIVQRNATPQRFNNVVPVMRTAVPRVGGVSRMGGIGRAAPGPGRSFNHVVTQRQVGVPRVMPTTQRVTLVERKAGVPRQELWITQERRTGPGRTNPNIVARHTPTTRLRMNVNMTCGRCHDCPANRSPGLPIGRGGTPRIPLLDGGPRVPRRIDWPVLEPRRGPIPVPLVRLPQPRPIPGLAIRVPEPPILPPLGVVGRPGRRPPVLEGIDRPGIGPRRGGAEDGAERAARRPEKDPPALPPLEGVVGPFASGSVAVVESEEPVEKAAAVRRLQPGEVMQAPGLVPLGGVVSSGRTRWLTLKEDLATDEEHETERSALLKVVPQPPVLPPLERGEAGG